MDLSQIILYLSMGSLTWKLFYILNKQWVQEKKENKLDITSSININLVILYI